MAALVDANILVYRFDGQQAMVEFLATVTRPIHGYSILKQSDALRETKEVLGQFTDLYPNEAILRNAIRAGEAIHRFGLGVYFHEVMIDSYTAMPYSQEK